MKSKLRHYFDRDRYIISIILGWILYVDNVRVDVDIRDSSGGANSIYRGSFALPSFLTDFTAVYVTLLGSFSICYKGVASEKS
jgi:hypothetical protein